MRLAPEIELELLRQEREQEARRLQSLQRAPLEGRWCRSERAWVEAVAKREATIRVFDRAIAEREAEMAA